MLAHKLLDVLLAIMCVYDGFVYGCFSIFQVVFVVNQMSHSYKLSIRQAKEFALLAQKPLPNSTRKQSVPCPWPTALHTQPDLPKEAPRLSYHSIYQSIQKHHGKRQLRRESIQSRQQCSRNRTLSIGQSRPGNSRARSCPRNLPIESIDMERLNKLFSARKYEEFVLLVKGNEHLHKNVQVNYMRAICQANIGNCKQSNQLFAKVAALSPKYNQDLYVIWANVLKKLKLNQEAIKVLERGFQQFSSLQMLLQLSKLLLKQGYSNKAEALVLQGLNRKQVQKQKLLAFLSDIYESQGQWQQAANCLRKLQGEKNKLKLGIMMRKRGKLHQAQQVLKQIPESSQYNQAALYQRGLVEIGLGNQDDAKFLFQTVVNSSRQTKLVQMASQKVIVLLITGKKFYEADYFIGSAQYLGLDTLKWKNLVSGLLYCQRGDYSRARTTLSAVCSNFKKSQDIRQILDQHLGFCLIALNQPQTAINYFNSQSYNHKLCQGLINLKNKKYQEAEQQLLRLQDLNNQAAFYLALLQVEMLFEQGEVFAQERLQSAKQYCLKVQRTQLKTHAYHLQSLICSYQKSWQEALRYADEAVKVTENCSQELHFLRGILRALLGYYPQAMTDFGLVLKLRPEHSKAYLYNAICFQMSDDLEQGFGLLSQRLDKIHQEKKQYQKALLDMMTYLYQNGAYEDCIELSQQHKSQNEDIRELVFRSLIKISQLESAVQYCQNSNLSEKYGEDIELLRTLARFKIDGNLAGVVQGIRLAKSRPTQSPLFDSKTVAALEGLALFYQGEYSQAQLVFQQIVQGYESLTSIGQLQSEDSFYLYQQRYNVALCCLLQNKVQQALLIIGKIITSDQVIRQRLPILADIMNSFEREDTTLSGSHELFDLFKTNQLQYFLSQIFQKKVLQLKEGKRICLRPSVSYPAMATKSIEIQFQKEQLRKYCSEFKEFKGQQPWLRVKGKAGLVFTEEIQTISQICSPRQE